jgi:hypothetical protein
MRLSRIVISLAVALGFGSAAQAKPQINIDHHIAQPAPLTTWTGWGYHGYGRHLGWYRHGGYGFRAVHYGYRPMYYRPIYYRRTYYRPVYYGYPRYGWYRRHHWRHYGWYHRPHHWRHYGWHRHHWRHYGWRHHHFRHARFWY